MIGKAKKSTKDFEMYKKACELDSSLCSSLARKLSDLGDPRAIEYHELSCKEGSWNGCYSASDHYLKRGDLASGEAMLRTGCEMGKQGGICFSYFQFLLVHKRHREAQTAFVSLCQNPQSSQLNFMCEDFKKLEL